MMNEKQVWAGPASELLFELEPLASGLPPDGTRISKELFTLASRLAARGIAVERMPRGRQRGIRLYRRYLAGGWGWYRAPATPFEKSGRVRHQCGNGLALHSAECHPT